MELDEEVEQETYFCCFKKQVQKKAQVHKSISDKMSIQQLQQSHYDISHQQIQEVKSLRQQIHPKLLNSMIESAIKINDYPKNKIFLLKNKQHKEQILAKITEKIFNQGDVGSSLSGDQLSPRKDSYEGSTPDILAKYIARRIYKKIQIVTDLGCGQGGNTVQFAKICEYVIAVDIDMKLCEKTTLNCQQHKVQDKVDIINADLFMLKKLKSDVIFVNPTVKLDENDYCSDLSKNCSPCLKDLLHSTISKTQNFILQLPALIDIAQIPIILNLNQIYLGNENKFYCLEIEQIFINKVHEYNVIYFGDVANVSRKTVLKFLYRQLDSVQKTPHQKENLIWLLDLIGTQIGMFMLVCRVLESVKSLYSVEQFCNFIQQKEFLEIDLIAAYKKRKMKQELKDKISEENNQSLQTNYDNQQRLLNNETQKEMAYQQSKDNDDYPMSPVNYSIKSEDLNQYPSMPNYFDQFENNSQENDEKQQHFIMNLHND